MEDASHGVDEVALEVGLGVLCFEDLVHPTPEHGNRRFAAVEADSTASAVGALQIDTLSTGPVMRIVVSPPETTPTAAIREHVRHDAEVLRRIQRLAVADEGIVVVMQAGVPGGIDDGIGPGFVQLTVRRKPSRAPVSSESPGCSRPILARLCGGVGPGGSAARHPPQSGSVNVTSMLLPIGASSSAA